MISAQTVQQMVDRVMTLPVGSRLVVLAPIIRGRKGEYRKLFFDLRRQGYVRVRVNGQLRELTEDIELAKTKKHTIEVVVDRLIVKDTLGGRLADSLETALRLADGIVQVEVPDGPSFMFSERLACAACGISFPEVSPRMFSFNNPYGACPECGGIGTRYEIDPERVVPDQHKTLAGGALAAVGRADRLRHLQADPPGPGQAPRLQPRDPVGQAAEEDPRHDPAGRARRRLRGRGEAAGAPLQGDHLARTRAPRSSTS